VLDIRSIFASFLALMVFFSSVHCACGQMTETVQKSAPKTHDCCATQLPAKSQPTHSPSPARSDKCHESIAPAIPATVVSLVDHTGFLFADVVSIAPLSAHNSPRNLAPLLLAPSVGDSSTLLGLHCALNT